MTVKESPHKEYDRGFSNGWDACAAHAQPAQAGPITSETGNAPDQGASSITFESGKAGQVLTDEEFLSSLDGDGIAIDPLLALDIKARVEQAVLAKRVPQWIATADQMPPPDAWLLVVWGDGVVDKAHTFSKWKHPTNPLGYLIQGHPGSHDGVTHWMPLPPPPGIVGEKGGA